MEKEEERYSIWGLTIRTGLQSECRETSKGGRESGIGKWRGRILAIRQKPVLSRLIGLCSSIGPGLYGGGGGGGGGGRCHGNVPAIVEGA